MVNNGNEKIVSEDRIIVDSGVDRHLQEMFLQFLHHIANNKFKYYLYVKSNRSIAVILGSVTLMKYELKMSNIGISKVKTESILLLITTDPN